MQLYNVVTNILIKKRTLSFYYHSKVNQTTWLDHKDAEEQSKKREHYKQRPAFIMLSATTVNFFRESRH